MVPQVVSVRVETAWHTGRLLLACVARISRALTFREKEEMARFSEFSVGSETETVTWSCRPEESEAYEKRLGAALRRSVEDSRTGRRRWAGQASVS
jgi:hypothetical protein